MKRLSSTRLRLAPSPPILISSSAVTSRLLCWLATRPGWWWLATRLGRGFLATRLGPELGRGPQHRLHDVLVTGAAAEVAGQRPAHFFLGRVGIGVEQGLGGQHHARGAEPALQPVFLFEALLQR